MKQNRCDLKRQVGAGACLWLALSLPLIALPSALGAEQSVARQWNEELLDAIRLDLPDPPRHARNLFNTAVAMYSAWAAYDPVAVGYLFHENVDPLPADVEAARHEAISYAAYRVLWVRFATGVSSAVTLESLDARLEALGYSPDIGLAQATSENTPAEVGKRAADAILRWGIGDDFTNPLHRQSYTAEVNPNLDVPLRVLGTNLSSMEDMPLGLGLPEGTNPNFWQPLELSTSFTQNGLPLPGGQQQFVGVQGMAATPFSLTRADPSIPWLDPFGGPSRLSVPGIPSPTDWLYKKGALDVLIASSLLNDDTLIDISPGAIGNSPLGTDDGIGFAVNPVTGEPYEPNLVRRGDFMRVLAEYWADGPLSETPPGHWHLLANQLSDRPDFERRIGGIGPELGALEWDIKAYFALSAALHDAACAAWSLKRNYSSARPITMIRYLASKGQSSDPYAPSYHPSGLPLHDGVVEIITTETTAEGERHHQIWDVATWSFRPGTDFLGEIAVYSWPGEHADNPEPPAKATHQSMVTWMLARDWLPYQRKTFNTPPFPGYVSGHSTYSRAGAEALTLLTGSPYFPGGFHSYTVRQHSMEMDLGPSEDLELQWATYADAADQAGISRTFGGIHPPEDDYPGRIIGYQVGRSAVSLAEKYWNGTILEEPVHVSISLADGAPALQWSGIRGMYRKIQHSIDLATWHDLTEADLSYDTNGRWIGNDPASEERRFYRVVWSPAP